MMIIAVRPLVANTVMTTAMLKVVPLKHVIDTAVDTSLSSKNIKNAWYR